VSVLAVLEGADGLAVDPGGVTSCTLRLSNTGTIVEQYAIMVLGDAAEWIHPDPPVVSMFPGAQQTVTLSFAPPRHSSTPAGPLPFAVKVIPSNQPEESVTEEGTVTVGSFNDVGAELLPRIVNGRVAGRQRLAIDSRGNVPVPVEVSARDPSDAIRFRVGPPALTAAPGATHFVRVAIRPRKRFWRGPPQLKPYQVQVEAAGEKPLVLDGQFKQSAVLPKWLFALAALVVAAVLLWYLLLRPVIRDTAANADKSALAAQAAQTKALQGQVNAAAQQAASASQAASKALSATQGGTTTTSTSTTTTTSTTIPAVSAATTIPPPVTSPSDGRLEVVAAPGSTGLAATGPVAAGTYVQITNLVIQNISGSSGTARIQLLVPGQPAQDMLVENLAQVTDQEYTFNTPIVLTHDEAMQLRVDCAADQTACDVGVFYTGPLTQPASATTTTIP
jgi:cytoskeletal protein RodZ